MNLQSRLRGLIPASWTDHLRDGMVCLGLDVASTTENKSNPSALSLMEHWDRRYWVRLQLRWKTGDLDVMETILRHVLKYVPRAQRKALVVDKSNEKFAANKLAKVLGREINVVGFAGGQKVRYQGEDSDAKTAMGAAYCAALEDGLIALPAGKWIRDDHRQVTRNGARFDAKVDKEGNHADVFDSDKLAYWGHIGKISAPVMPYDLGQEQSSSIYDMGMANTGGFYA